MKTLFLTAFSTVAIGCSVLTLTVVFSPDATMQDGIQTAALCIAVLILLLGVSRAHTMPPSDDIKVIKDRRPTKADEDEYGHVWMEPEPFTDRPWCNVCAAYVGPDAPWCHTDEWVEPQPLPDREEPTND